MIRDADGEYYQQSSADWPARKAERDARMTAMQAERDEHARAVREQDSEGMTCDL